MANQVRTAYWNLRSQIEQVEIQRRNLAQAEQLLENNRVRVRAGTMVEMDLAQAEVQVANAEQALLNAQIQWQAQELAFKRLLIGGIDDPLWQQTVNPVDMPAIEEREVNIEAALAEARAARIAAKAVTPFLLQRIFDLTGGASLEANIALVRNNARLSAAIAKEIARAAPRRD